MTGSRTKTRCPYSPINGTQCPKQGRTVVTYGSRSRLLPPDVTSVCAEHLPRYLANGWNLVP